MANKKNNNKKQSFSQMLMIRLFGNDKNIDMFEEEQVISPFRTVVNTYSENKVSMTSLAVFLIIVAIMLIGPLMFPIDLSYTDISQIHVPPGRDFLKVPDALKEDARSFSSGPTFSVGVDKNGDVHVWGKSKVTTFIDIADVPKEVKEANIVKVACGMDHVVALADDGRVLSWGNNRQMQSEVPYQFKEANDQVVDIYATYQLSLVLTKQGYVESFGNRMIMDFDEFNEHQGEIVKLAPTSTGVMALTESGEVTYMGTIINNISRVPEHVKDIVDIAATSETVAALDEDGNVTVWGNPSRTYQENKVPEIEDGKIVKLYSGRHNYTGLKDNGDLVTWGSNLFGESNPPKNVKFEKMYSEFFGNYGIDTDGKLHTWGLKGYLLGTDELGRDVARRLLNGGRMSLFIGAIAVVISTFIGIVVGGISGFFGGKIDMVLQRIAEMIASLPFLPFAMILNSLIGSRLPSNQRVFLIMIVLGLLSWTGLQRLVRAQVLSIREQEYVIAARSLGIKTINIVFKHILPNVVSVIIVNATLNFASSMLTEATLSYLGFGVQPPQPTWGNMLFSANNSIIIEHYWWRWIFGAILISICVVCINLIGDGLRDAIDPKSRQR
ncbi:MAG: ABC transporter permease subunit [Tissierellia bacterium]|nr:ABC transporter permease subunit [Tissierellia bacterium]